MSRLFIPALMLVVATSLIPHLPAGEKPKIQVTGSVQNSEKKPIAGVQVIILTAGRGDSVASDKTKDDGTYEIKATLTASFDIVYTHTKYNLSLVSLLSEEKNQNINKVLYAKGEATNASAMIDHLQSVERVQLLAMGNSSTERKKLLSLADKLGIWDLLRDSALPHTAKLTLDTRETLEAKFAQLKANQRLLNAKKD